MKFKQDTPAFYFMENKASFIPALHFHEGNAHFSVIVLKKCKALLG